MKKLFPLLLIFFATAWQPFAQQANNLIIITYDGFRWQEVFRGVDSVLMHSKTYNPKLAEMSSCCWAATPEQRREKLLPFLWKTVAVKGQVHGNRTYGSKVSNANPHWFSFPGYNEIFTGNPDPKINSNDKINNPFENVLEFINRQPGFQGKVAAFASWDAFPYILNEERGKFTVNAGWENLTEGKDNQRIQYLNYLQHQAPKLIDEVRWDFLTFQFAFEYLKENKPRVLYIGFDENDDFAHMGRYDYYIEAARSIDKWIAELWDYIQKDPFYANKTALFLTTDHGRGFENPDTWKDHGKNTPDSHETWFAVMGPGIAAKGEVKNDEMIFEKQFAKTFAAILGLDFKPKHPAGEAINLKK